MISSISKSSPPPSSRRNPVLTTVDVIVGIVLIGFGAVLGLTVIVNALSYDNLSAGCGAGPYEGLVCNGGVLGVAVYGMIIVAVLAWFLGLGFFIVSLLRKRLAFIWPLAAILVTITAFYLGTWVASMTAVQA